MARDEHSEARPLSLKIHIDDFEGEVQQYCPNSVSCLSCNFMPEGSNHAVADLRGCDALGPASCWAVVTTLHADTSAGITVTAWCSLLAQPPSLLVSIN